MSLSSLFNFESIGGFSKTLFVGGLLTISGAVFAEPIVLALGHMNSGGIAFMEAASPWLNNAFDAMGITEGLHTLAEMVPEAPSGTELADGSIELSTNATPPSEDINAALESLENDW